MAFGNPVTKIPLFFSAISETLIGSLFIRALFYIYVLIFAYYNQPPNLMHLYCLLVLTMAGQYYWAYTSFLSVRRAYYKIKDTVNK